MHPDVCKQADAVGLSADAIKRMVNKECPLGFHGKDEWNEFSDGLSQCIETGISKFGSRLNNTAARFIGGFTIIANGSAMTFWSETPNKKGRRFDEVKPGSSDIDVAIVFDTCVVDPQSNQFVPVDVSSVKALFFDTPSRSHQFFAIQYAESQCRKRFQLESKNGVGWRAEWQTILGREISLVFAGKRTNVLVINGIDVCLLY